MSSKAQDHETQAARAYVRRTLGQWSEGDESRLAAALHDDPRYADAYRRVASSWDTVGRNSTSPELMRLREAAITRARKTNARRWGASYRRQWRIAAGIVVVGLMSLAAYRLAPFGWRPGEYRTQIAEQRVIELDDRSHVVLDATTQLRVRFSRDARIIELIHGQAQFSVAKDPARPFKVEAGDRAIVALGTIFTVEYTDRTVHVATMEGKVAVLPLTAAPPAMQEAGEEISLSAGEAVQVASNGRLMLDRKADLDAATAWRVGKVIFHSEPLGEAVLRLNRYSRLQLRIEDPELAAMHVSGVFDAGDTAAFVEAVRAYLPVTADESRAGVVRLRISRGGAY